MLLGLHLLSEEKRVKEVSLALDNQAVIKATDDNQPKPGHDLIDRILDAANKIRKKNGRRYKLTV